jgi:polysaccharide export outer membrane protein
VPANGQSVPGGLLGQVGYRLYPGDLLRIDIFDHPDLSCQIRIPTSGSSSFPLLGDVGPLAGRGISDFCDDLRRRLEADYLRQAVITSTIVEFGPRFAYVLGSVRLPSAVPLPPLRVTTSMQAIAEAGGFAEDANRASARVIRDNPNGMGKISMSVPPTDQAGALADDINLLPGDVVIVPQLDRIYVVGKVTRPGAISLPSQEVLTVSKAISLAGGFDRFAVQDGVQLVRPGEVKTIDVKGILTGNKIEDPVLLQGDTVYVPEARF